MTQANPVNPNEVNIDFTLTLAETNLILQVLSQRPYIEVANLIHNMQRVAHNKVTPPIEATQQRNIEV